MRDTLNRSAYVKSYGATGKSLKRLGVDLQEEGLDSSIVSGLRWMGGSSSPLLDLKNVGGAEK